MPARRTARAPRPASRKGKASPPESAPLAPVRGPSIALHEPPHAHIVCRSCGRISGMDLLPEEAQQLIALADRRPDGWDVSGVAFSLTGTCAACREGRRA